MTGSAVRVAPLALVFVIIKTVKITGMLPITIVTIATTVIMEFIDIYALNITTIYLAVAIGFQTIPAYCEVSMILFLTRIYRYGGHRQVMEF